jgi:hypothetical protein
MARLLTGRSPRPPLSPCDRPPTTAGTLSERPASERATVCGLGSKPRRRAPMERDQGRRQGGRTRGTGERCCAPAPALWGSEPLALRTQPPPRAVGRGDGHAPGPGHAHPSRPGAPLRAPRPPAGQAGAAGRRYRGRSPWPRQSGARGRAAGACPAQSSRHGIAVARPGTDRLGHDGLSPVAPYQHKARAGQAPGSPRRIGTGGLAPPARSVSRPAPGPEALVSRRDEAPPQPRLARVTAHKQCVESAVRGRARGWARGHESGAHGASAPGLVVAEARSVAPPKAPSCGRRVPALESAGAPGAVCAPGGAEPGPQPAHRCGSPARAPHRPPAAATAPAVDRGGSPSIRGH